MKRLWISLLIFVGLVILCIFGTQYTGKVSVDLMKTVSQAKSAEQQGNTAAAVELSRKAGQDWRDVHRLMCTYMPHSKLEAIDQTLAGLPMLSQYGAKEQFLADCDRCLEQFSYLNESEVPSIANIF